MRNCRQEMLHRGRSAGPIAIIGYALAFLLLPFGAFVLAVIK